MRSIMANTNTKRFTPDETQKLKAIINSCVVTMQHQFDLAEHMKEIVQDAAQELDIKPQQIKDAARVLFKQNLMQMRSKHADIEAILEAAGYDFGAEE